ncbi:MAG: hypothetical protein IKP28_02855 [Clostridia bacterium]|nr:hypothetical protein [Clostridia bacterium]
MKDFLQSQKGYTGIDLAVAIVILSIFTFLISTIFVNIYTQYTDASRSAAATAYATAIAENLDKTYYQYLIDPNDTSAIDAAISAANLTSGYTAQVNIGNANSGGKDLIRNIQISVSYKLGNNTKSITINRTKSKEILIIPNKPKVPSGMVPVKYVITDYISETGYWQITTEEDTTWYNYENKTWAYAMALDGLEIEGYDTITDSNKSQMTGKRVIEQGVLFAWIPKYAYNSSTTDVKFSYSTTEKTVDSNGYLENINNTYSINSCFGEYSGFWISKADANSSEASSIEGATVNAMTNAEGTTVTNLATSSYGPGTSSWSGLTNGRLVVKYK